MKMFTFYSIILVTIFISSQMIIAQICPLPVDMNLIVQQSVPKDFQLEVYNPDGHQLRFISPGLGLTHGELIILNESTGEARFVPEFGWCGTTDVEFAILDLTTPECPAPLGTISINIICNGCPIANDMNLSIPRNSSYEFELDSFDPENDPITFGIPVSPAHGSIDLDNLTGIVVYTPDEGYCGFDEFQFHVFDEFNSNCNDWIGIVSIEVRCNECPVANDVYVNSIRGDLTTFELDGFDPDGDPIVYTYHPPGVDCGSVVSFSADGIVVYSSAGCGNNSTELKYKVYDGECLSDEATVYITIADPVPIDIKPGSCPNPLSTTDKGMISVAIIGTSDFDVSEVDPATVRIEGIEPVRWDLADVVAPFLPYTGKTSCSDCNTSRKDRIGDLIFKFDARMLISALVPVTNGECRVVKLTGEFFDGTGFIGEDVVRIQGTLERSGEDESTSDILSSTFLLEQNFPNPFNPTTNIVFHIAEYGFVSLKVYDVMGKEVAVLVNEDKNEGIYEVEFDAGNLASGTYFYRLSSGSFTETKKLLLMK